MAAKEQKEQKKSRRGRRALPSDPREGFLQLVQGPTGRVQKVLDSLETLGKVASATVPNPDGEGGRIPVDYDPEEDIAAIEEAVMQQVEATFKRLRERPVGAKAGKSGFTL